jgi:hypothetical protein
MSDLADRLLKAFNFMVDRQDDRVVSLFAGYLKTYIDEQAESGPDPYQSPKIRPFDGTVLQDPLLNEVKLDEGNEGLLTISNDNDSSDEAEIYETPGHISTYWKPQRGKISIVTTELATSLAQATGCSFFPDHGANRVGISGVNFNQALYKLQNLERLQVRQRMRPRTKALLTRLDTCCFSAIRRVLEGSRQCSDARKSRTEHCHPVPPPHQRHETLRTHHC